MLEIAKRRQKKVFEWSYSSGIIPAGTSIQSQKHRNTPTKDPLAALDQVIEQVEPAIFIFKDFHPFLTKNNFAIVRKLNAATQAVLSTPIVQQRLKDIGATLVTPERRSPEYLTKFVADEIEKWAGPIKAAGVTGE